MKIEADATLPFELPLVYASYRDKIVELLPHLPDIRDIVVEERREEGPIVHLVSTWYGGADIPAAARKFIKEDMINWTDIARWDADEHAVEWRIETHAFTEAVICSGKNFFRDAGGGRTRLEIRGDMRVDASKITGVPRLLVKKVSAIAERYLVGSITPNLTSVSDGLVEYLKLRA